MANPLVRPHMHFLSEDAGDILKESWQAEKWKDEVNAELSGPMVRQDGKDFFIEEPALANIEDVDGSTHVAPVIPMRWFMREGKVWGKVHRLREHPVEHAFIIDARSPCEELPLTSFFNSYVELKTDHRFFGLPDPSKVVGMYSALCLVPWVLIRGTGIARSGSWNRTDLQIEPCFDIQVPSPLRALADGKRVLALPIWFYCDDTSGNLSKKWNKHNSLLFTLAGLPRALASLAYNVHFLATSNIASPLEMFDAIVNILR
jgi:hypothetical protein